MKIYKLSMSFSAYDMFPASRRTIGYFRSWVSAQKKALELVDSYDVSGPGSPTSYGVDEYELED